MNKVKTLEKMAKRLRIHSLRMTTRAGSGHPTTCLSMAEIAACLFFQEMKFNTADPNDALNDEFILSKGHAAPILWAAYAEAGLIPQSSLQDLRKITSNLEGHPTPRMPWVKAATGSLGQGLAVGVGMAYAQRLNGSPARTYVLMGDGECAEGAVWEAANAASLLKLANLCAIVDINRLGQSDFTMHRHDIAAYVRKFKAFGWTALPVDGHKVKEVLEALAKARSSRGPAVVLAKTTKGKGVSFLEDRNGWHGKPLKEDELKSALAELGEMPALDGRRLVKARRGKRPAAPVMKYDLAKTDYKEKTATRWAYGQALVSLGRINQSVVVIDGDVKNSTYADKFFEAFPERSFQSYIAEQNIVGMGIGLAAKGYIPFVATFAAFLTRAHDQVRMAAYSFSNLKLCGSHVGVSIGQDGPSQMGLEDLAMFRPIPGCIVLYPCDAISAEACVEAMASHKGMVYLRTTRPATPILYQKGEAFPIGGSKVLKAGPDDRAVVVAAGITVHEALKAWDELKKAGLNIRVVDAYSVQPLDAVGLRHHAQECGGRVVVVEDHFPAGGLGEAVAAELAGSARVEHLCVRELPRSGKPEELLEAYGISARRIRETIEKMLAK